MSTTSSFPQVAFFGATGGCALAALIMTIKAGIPCSALVRNPEKLSGLLQNHGMSDTSDHLTIIKGDVKDIAAVKEALTAKHEHGCTPIIVSGIGGTPALKWSVTKPVTLTDPNICTNATTSIIQALKELDLPTKPLICVLSTTGISKRRDVPVAFQPFYHWLLAVPHVDKANMEDLLNKEAANVDSVFSGAVRVRPSLLVDGAPKGLEQVRVGWEFADGSSTNLKGAPGPAIGYTIGRDEVGGWIYTQIIASNETTRLQWAGKVVTLTT